MATQTEDKVAYPIQRTFRLNYNHLLMKETAGYLINPRIPTSQKEIRIADVGTGTAAWALETAAKYPNATIHGFDISDEQFSPLYTISNVRLVVHDCFKEFPAEFVEQYDVVHARFWLCLVNNPDAPVLLKNLMSLLKPGGYLQWFEPLAKSVSVWKPDPNMPSPALDRHCKIWAKPKPYTTYEWVEQLPELFRSHGLTSVATDRHLIGDQFRAMWGQSNLAGYLDLVEENVEGVGDANDIKSFVRKLEEEMKKGASFDTTFLCVVGRKAL
ncbi:hypothetical protein HO133_000618 [Letharia lupina]|uniref:S-adenosyl-L-methionine-dependent methyltransferase n=1 Tax=Letharia lupina TaxID=560253 RepID=A0A8H6FC90_9LECA|nr:uncharacterized protein HO133_000618 [Letharia lupina]KAF6222573.1 hypothetical protein HO133_000618 [Letharia lupina]